MPVILRAWYYPEQKMYYRAYQKWFSVVLCDDDHGQRHGMGIPVKRAPYQDCILLESTFLKDNHGCEIFEGDRVHVTYQGKEFEDIVDGVPDMFKSRKIHPLTELFKRQGLCIAWDDSVEDYIEVIGHQFV